jgi:PAS domain S-box-containing protein
VPKLRSIVTTTQFRTVLALLAVCVLTLPIGRLAAGLQRQADSLDDRAHQYELIETDLRSLEVGMTDQQAGLRGYLVVANPAFLSDYDLGKRETQAAWSRLTTDARGSGLEASLPQLKSSVDAWQGWAGQRSGAPAPADASSAMADGDRLFERFRVAVGFLAGRATGIAASQRVDEDAIQRQAHVADILGRTALPAAVLLLGSIMLWLALRPVHRLATVSNRLAASEEPEIPYVDRPYPVGAIARALLSYRHAAASHRAMWQHTPIAMLTYGPSFKVQDANPAMVPMFGWSFKDMLDDTAVRNIGNATHPDDEKATARMYGRLMSGKSEKEKLEKRYIRKDGSVFWGMCVVAVVRDTEGKPAQYVTMVEDISERKEKVARAAQVQRGLLPDAAPELEGYELTGLCRPTEDVSGDFFDWYQPDPRTLTLTLGDVMGKGMPAAILMATMRIALRSSSWQATAAEAVQSVADSTMHDLEKAETFMTLFHARLDLEDGLLTYVDAGHALAVLLDETGGTWLRGASPPLGVVPDTTYSEASVTMRPGSTLVVFSDGVLDVHPELEEDVVGATVKLVEDTASVQEAAERVSTNPDAQVMDDVTVVVLHRRP